METSCVVLTFESVDEILWCDYSNETSSAILLHGTICFSFLFSLHISIVLPQVCVKFSKQRLHRYQQNNTDLIILALSCTKRNNNLLCIKKRQSLELEVLFKSFKEIQCMVCSQKPSNACENATGKICLQINCRFTFRIFSSSNQVTIFKSLMDFFYFLLLFCFFE